jgi:hypothetical protein
MDDELADEIAKARARGKELGFAGPDCTCTGAYPDAACPEHGVLALLRADAARLGLTVEERRAMTTTDNWREVNKAGSVYVHKGGMWALVRFEDGHNERGAWHLFGPGAPGRCMATGELNPALDLLLASRLADQHIGELTNWPEARRMSGDA